MNPKNSYWGRMGLAFPMLLFVVGVVTFGAAAYYQHQSIENDARAEFERMSVRTDAQISDRLEKVVTGLRGASGLYAADRHVDRGAFQRFILSRDMEREFPGVRGFGFIQRVERTDLNAFVEAERADGAPDFTIHQLTDKSQQDLFVVKFIEPAANNLGALGLDVGSETLRRAALRQAINTGATTVTGAITLVQDDKKRPSVLLYQPVYRAGEPLGNATQRNAALVGVLYAPIVIEEILQGVTDVQSGLLDFEIVDSLINSSGGVVMFDADNHLQYLPPGADPSAGRRYSLTKPLQLPGRSVTLSMRSTPAFDATVNQTAPWLLFCGGALISGLLAIMLYQQANGRRHAEALAQDMTKDLQIALRDNSALLSTLNLHAIVSVTDRGGRILEVNDAFCQISGYARSELLGQNHRIVNSGVQPQEFWVQMWKAISSGRPWRGQVCNLSKEGHLYWVDTLIAAFIGSDGQIEKYVSIRTDITASKKAEEDLRWSQSLMDRMSNSSPLGFLVVDNRSDEILYFNQRFCALWGIEHQAERMGRRELKNHDLDPDCLRVLVDANAYFESCKPLQIEGNRITLEDEIAFTNQRTVRRFTTQIRDANDNYYGRFYIFEDITERKNAELALTRAIEAAQAASVAKSQFLANMSHEIRTPMNAVLGLLSLLQSTELTNRQRDYAGKTEGAARSLLGLLNDILDFSKVEAGKMTLESEPFQIDQLMRNLSVVLSANVGAKDIEVLFDMDPTLPTVVRGDAMRLQQVLINLGGNAVKFTSIGQVVLAMRKLAESEGTVTIEFAVQDTGVGIAAEHQEQIFIGFSQAEGSTTRLFGGTGLGLAISKRFVELMGSAIQISSEPGVGSTFSFVLELPKVVLHDGAQMESRGPMVQPQRVLVVDDNPVAADLTLRMVRSWGWMVELARSGTEALERISAKFAAEPAEFPYPVIYMDWKMPDMDGWETIRKIRQWAGLNNLPQPVVIMFTAHGREMLSQRTEEEQALINGFLGKPATASMLYDALMDANAGNAGIRKLTKGRSSNRQLTGMRVLVVEDNLINQQVAEELLTAEGAMVSLAANGQLGVDAVAAAAPQFDVVLMDVQMPVLDGYGATRAIREDLHLVNLPIIAMTANALASDREACLAAGMNEHIGKPFDLPKLVSLLIRITGINSDLAPSDSEGGLHPQSPDVPEVPGLDIQTALNRMAGIRSLYLRTAKDFIRILDTAIPELQRCMNVGDQHKAVVLLHTLKGNAGTLGANGLAVHAAKLEKLCATTEGMKQCEALLPPFTVEVQSTQEKMREAIALLGAEPAGAVRIYRDTPSSAVSKAAIDALHRVAALANASDLEVLETFAQTRDLLAEFPLQAAEALEMALQDLNLAEAANLCDQMLSQLKP